MADLLKPDERIYIKWFLRFQPVRATMRIDLRESEIGFNLVVLTVYSENGIKTLINNLWSFTGKNIPSQHYFPLRANLLQP